MWGDYDNLEIVTEAFMAKNHGQIWIGSEDCLFTRKATITLTGTPSMSPSLSFILSYKYKVLILNNKKSIWKLWNVWKQSSWSWC